MVPTLARTIEELKQRSGAGGRLMDQVWSILFRAEARLGLITPLRRLGGAAPADVR